jgi:response regulator RpfG family c-di-GMP phosphodiesterase
VVEEVGAVAPLALATTATAAVVALALGSLGPVAVPLFMVPLVLLQLAVGQQATIREAQLQTIRALSRLTEQGGFTPHGHAARVARLAVPMGRVIGLAERDLLDLEYAALLHDLGQVSLRRPIPGGATVQTSTVDQRRIAGVGAAILARTAELSRLSPVIADQATPYRRSVEIGRIPIGSRILKVANAFDDLVGAQVSPVAAQRALRRIRLGTGYEYDPMVVRALCSVLEREGQMSSRDLARLDI